jgi:hypothetical protein
MTRRTAGVVGVHVDDHELEQLEVDLRQAPTRVQLGSKKTLRRGAELVDKAMVHDARGHRYLPRFPRNISHGMVGDLEAEIGFDRSKGLQGSLVWIILHGSINNAPVWDYTAGLRRSTPEILEMFGQTAEDATLGTREA